MTERTTTERTTTGSPSASRSTRVVLAVPGREPVVVEAELATTEPQRRRGLMFRRHMPRDGGMLFVFERPERQSFWMRNTFLPLDMIFISEQRRVVGVIEDARPLSDEARAVDAESLYVLEVHAGFARANGVTVGTPVELELPGREVAERGEPTGSSRAPGATTQPPTPSVSDPRED